ncbi:hypothetical protein ACT29H_00890 [Thermophagus sp. OGC60D27]|uniref:hypothetical protein n=1 Tax=Thermophagus sp. OGC60D27 TaxID=3458415 RepID=UPI004037EDC8
MKKIYTISFLCFILWIPGISQKVKKEKFILHVPTKPLIKLKNNPESYFCKDFHFNIEGLKKTEENPDLFISIKSYPAAKHSSFSLEHSDSYGNKSPITDFLCTQPFEVTIKDSNKNIIFHRTYNIFDFIDKPIMNPEHVATPDRLDSDLSIQMDMSRYFSYLFSPNYTPRFEIKLNYITKSQNHDDINSAFESAKQGIDLFNQKHFEEAKTELNKALEIWMKALEEKNLSNKKARINKNITKGIYDNVIQTLILLDRFEEADELITSIQKEIQGIYAALLGKHYYLLTNLKNIKMANEGNSDFHFVDLEYDESVKPMVKGEEKMKPNSPQDIRNLLHGSWRFMLITKDGLPASIEDYDYKNREKNLLGKGVEQILHLNPDGTSIHQEGAWDEGETQNMEGAFSGYWRYTAVPNPKDPDKLLYFLFFAMEKEELNNVMENIRSLEYLGVYSINDRKLILKAPNFNPNVDGRGYYVQLQRIDRPKF